MGIKYKSVDFRISRRTLWVDLEAYPLSQITRVRPVELKPNRRWMIQKYSRMAAATIALGMAGVVGLSCLGEAVSSAAYLLPIGAMLAVLSVHTVRLVRGLIRPSLHVLSVATAGSPHAALVSTDKELIHDLTRRVVDAIDNPSAEFEILVNHVEIVHGDKVGGDKYGGDRVEGDKILEGGS